jgi:hypothetical protein
MLKKIAIWNNPLQARTVSDANIKRSMGASRVAEKLFWQLSLALVTLNRHHSGIKEVQLVCEGKRHRIIHHKPMLLLPAHRMKRVAKSADIKFTLHKRT